MAEVPGVGAESGGSEARKVSVAQILVYELRVRDAMTPAPVTAAPEETLRKIQGLMKTHRISGVPITEQGSLVGVVSIEDIINALDKGHINDPAERWMAHQPVTVRDHFSLMKAVGEFDRHKFGRFPVLDAQDSLVGIITQGDITACLMHHIEQRAEVALAHEAALLAERQADDQARRQVIHTDVKAGDFENAGKLSQRMRQVLRERGIEPDLRRRAAVVAYEAETNIIIHSVGGEITVTIYPDRILIEAVDQGPGIENIEQAMREGYSTAGPLARQLGFGAGMGLPNMKRCSDRFQITSILGGTTRVWSEVRLAPAKPAAGQENLRNDEIANIVADDSG